jgi:hypothetical protein
MNPNIEKLINEYFDDELEKGNEAALFSILSQDNEGQNYFKKMNFLKTSLKDSQEDFPVDLEERIFYSIHEKNQKRKKFFTLHNFFTIGSYAVAAIFLIISILLFNQVKDYKKEVDNTVKAISAKSETIELLLENTLPPAEVKAKSPDKIIIRANL